MSNSCVKVTKNEEPVLVWYRLYGCAQRLVEGFLLILVSTQCWSISTDEYGAMKHVIKHITTTTATTTTTFIFNQLVCSE